MGSRYIFLPRPLLDWLFLWCGVLRPPIQAKSVAGMDGSGFWCWEGLGGSGWYGAPSLSYNLFSDIVPSIIQKRTSLDAERRLKACEDIVSLELRYFSLWRATVWVIRHYHENLRVT